MNDAAGPLEQAFLQDHQHLTKGFWGIIRALRADDLPQAAKLAAELDEQAGPHIEFEEAVLYPEIAQIRGSEFAHNMCREHQLGLHVVRSLMDQPSGPLHPELKLQLIDEAEQALEHAASCAGLMSHVSAFPPKRQQELLEQLLVYRRKGCRWSDLIPAGN